MIFFIKNAIISILISVESESLCDIQSVQKFAFELQSTVAKTWSTSFSFSSFSFSFSSSSSFSFPQSWPTSAKNILDPLPYAQPSSSSFTHLHIANVHPMERGKNLLFFFAIRSKRGFPTSRLGRDFQLANQFVSQRESCSEGIRQLIFRDKFIDGRYSRPDAASNVSKAAITRSLGEWFHRTLQPTQPSF